jgi:hypothetical protein
MKNGTKVRYDRDSLGASNPDDLAHIVSIKPKKGDTGIVLRPHENRKMCQGWYWTEWEAPDGRKLVVGVTEDMVTILS